MAVFTNLLPEFGQTDVARTTLINFTILTDGYGGANIATLGVTVDGYQVISAGSFVGGHGGTIISATGKYVVGIYPKAPSFLPSAKEIAVHMEVDDAYGSLDAYDYSFFTSGYGVVPTPPLTADAYVNARICDRTKPFFPPTDLGLVAAFDKGVGTEINLTWKQAYPSNDLNIIYYNVYLSSNIVSVLDGGPDFLVADTSATVAGLPPGDTHFFTVRVAEFSPNDIELSGLRQAGPDMYFYPSTISDGYVGNTDTFVPAESVTGFPDSGVIHIGSELIKYYALQSLPISGFLTTSTTRGYAGTQAESHSAGSSIKLYHGKEDGNTIIAQATPTFQKPNDALTWVRIDGYGLDGYRDGYDGYDAYKNNLPGFTTSFDGYDGYLRYRQEPFDAITTDGKNNDESGDFNRFDYCGTWRTTSPANFMQGQCNPSYWGGIQVRDGYKVKVSDVRTHMLQREELLLESTGEPFVLLRRSWTGMRCACMMTRREHTDARCPICFSTGFTQGFVQFFNPRRSDRRILVRIDPAVDDLNLVDRGGLEPNYEPTAWTLPFPAIKDRDVLIRFNPDNTEEFRYEVLNVTRVRSTFAQTGAQKLTIKRLPKTDIMYQFPAVRDTRPIPGAISTSVNGTPGITAHSHQIVIPDGADLSTLRAATLISEGHNHIIISGVVQPVLGHTHTL